MQGDATRLSELPIPRPIDLVMDMGTFHTLSDEGKAAYVHELAAVMTPGTPLMMWQGIRIKPGEIPAAWVGRYQAQVVSATSGKEGDAVSTFGKGLSQTTLMLQTQACAQSFTMDVSRSGAITGRGRIMYVYQGNAGSPMMMMAPAAAAAGAGGFTVNLKDGKQFRDWNFTGQVSPDGTVTINNLLKSTVAAQEALGRLVGERARGAPADDQRVGDQRPYPPPLDPKDAQHDCRARRFPLRAQR